MEAYYGGMVKSRNNSPCIIIDKVITTLNESTNFEDAYLVEGIKYNLLSVA